MIFSLKLQGLFSDKGKSTRQVALKIIMNIKIQVIFDGKKPISLYFPSLDQVRNMHNYPRVILNPMHKKKKKKKHFCILKGFKKC